MTPMTPMKRDTLKACIKMNALALEAGVSRQALSRAMSGGAGLSREAAARVASIANRVTGYSCYEVHDFNSKLSPNLREITDDTIIELTNLRHWHRERMTAKRFRDLYEDDLEALSLLALTAHDGERHLTGDIVLSILDEDDLTDV